MKYLQRRRQGKIRKAISNTKRYKALSEAEKVRQKHLKAEIDAKKELDALRIKTQNLRAKRGSVGRKELVRGARVAGKMLKKLDKTLFG